MTGAIHSRAADRLRSSVSPTLPRSRYRTIHALREDRREEKMRAARGAISGSRRSDDASARVSPEEKSKTRTIASELATEFGINAD